MKISYLITFQIFKTLNPQSPIPKLYFKFKNLKITKNNYLFKKLINLKNNFRFDN